MKRYILSGLLGLVAANPVIFAVEYLNSKLFPLPPGGLALAVTNAPPHAFFGVLVAWALGSSVGSFVASYLLSPGRVSPASYFVIGALQLGAIYNNYILSAPSWFWIISMLEFLPFGYVSARMDWKSWRFLFGLLIGTLMVVHFMPKTNLIAGRGDL